jgi:hypothetical protein
MNVETTETSTTLREEAFSVSTVKTPLVDALRSYFQTTLQYGKDGCPLSYPDPI